MTDNRGTSLPESLLAMLVTVLDVVILERQAGGAFRQFGGDPPSWFLDAMKHTDAGAPVTIVQAFPVLESFLAEADTFWRATAYGRLEGEAFVVADPGGRNLAIAPIAVVLEGRRFLLLQRAAGFDERQRVLQRAREQALDREELVKRIDALRRPVQRLKTAAGDFRKQPLSEMQAGIVMSLLDGIETVETILADLPKLPPGASAQKRP